VLIEDDSLTLHDIQNNVIDKIMKQAEKFYCEIRLFKDLTEFIGKIISQERSDFSMIKDVALHFTC